MASLKLVQIAKKEEIQSPIYDHGVISEPMYFG